jgi:hypothetical protein
VFRVGCAEHIAKADPNGCVCFQAKMYPPTGNHTGNTASCRLTLQRMPAVHQRGQHPQPYTMQHIQKPKPPAIKT